VFHAIGSEYAGDVKGINNYLGAGSYEVRKKVAPKLEVCSAIWTFFYNDDEHTSNSNAPIVNHEIDIEIPGRPGPENMDIDFDQALLNTWVGEVEYTLGYITLPNCLDVDQFHTWRFDWHTVASNRRVDFFLDGEFIRTATTHIPTYAGRLWLGAWFPNG